MIPVVTVNGVDPIGEGLVANLARPGSYIIGLVQVISSEPAGERLQPLREKAA